MTDIFDALLEQDKGKKELRFERARELLKDALNWVTPAELSQLAGEYIYQTVAEDAMKDHFTGHKHEAL